MVSPPTCGHHTKQLGLYWSFRLTRPLVATLVWLAAAIALCSSVAALAIAAGVIGGVMALVSVAVQGFSSSEHQQRVTAHWEGYDEFLADTSFQDLPVTAVVLWDRHLAYAVAVGRAKRVSMTLAPDFDEVQRQTV